MGKRKHSDFSITRSKKELRRIFLFRRTIDILCFLVVVDLLEDDDAPTDELYQQHDFENLDDTYSLTIFQT